MRPRGRVDGLLTQAAAPHLTGRPRAAVPRPPPHRAQYIASEREKFGREVDNATAEREVDEWLLKQARPCPSRPAGLATACLPDGQAGAPAAAATRLPPCARAQATNASTKTSAADIAASVLVFALAFGVGTYQLWGGSSP